MCLPVAAPLILYRSHKEEQASSAESAPSSTAAAAVALMFNCSRFPLLIVGSYLYRYWGFQINVTVHTIIFSHYS